jgi:hypothetical protein
MGKSGFRCLAASASIVVALRSSNPTPCPPIPPHRRAALAVTLQIVSVVCFTFVCYLTIGLPLAVLPGFVHDDLGYSAIVAGAAISVQYFATLASRPLAGRFADTLGPKQTVLRGLIGCGVSGVLLLVALLLARWPAASLVLLIGSRLVLGVGESLCGTGAILWGIGRVGIAHNAKVISWNGIATYGALALGAPVGVAIAHALNPALIGVLVIALAAAGFYLARLIDAVPLVHGERMSYASVFTRAAARPRSRARFGRLRLDRDLRHALLRGAPLAQRGAVVDRVRHAVHRRAPAVREHDQDLRRLPRRDRVVRVRILGPPAAVARAGAARRARRCRAHRVRLRADLPGARRGGRRAGAAGEPRRGAVRVFGVPRPVARDHRPARRLHRRRIRLSAGVPVRCGGRGSGRRAVDGAVSAAGARGGRGGGGTAGGCRASWWAVGPASGD